MNPRDRIRALTFCLSVAWIVVNAAPVAANKELPGIASYKIEVQLKLDEQQHPTRLEGREQILWRNASPDTIRELQFHLYLNAFKNQRSTFFKESGGQLRGNQFEAGQWGQWGWIDLNEIKVAGGADLTKQIEFIHPDDDNAEDQTVIRVPLDKPLAPGATLTLDIRFTAKLPRVFARTGYWGQFALVAQWFPKLGVWEEVGERRRMVAGWNCHQFHANSEFYADFGNYDVTLTVPAIYKGKVGATGQQQSEQANADGTVTYRFAQNSVHDFAWTLDPGYVVVKRAFKADEWVKPTELAETAQQLKLPLEAVKLRDVECTLLIQPEHAAQTDRHFNAAFNALKYYGLWYGAYPYATLTIVDPPYNGGGAGGMEYPTFITAGTDWWLTPRFQEPEMVIVHEFGHQFWYGLVASNEFEESWLDEGFNTYSTTRTLDRAYGSTWAPFKYNGVPLFDFPVELPHPYLNRPGVFMEKFNDPILTPAWKYFDSFSYGINSYPRTGLTLMTLENYLGADVMARVLREYATQWRYRHPTSQDFFDTANAVAGQDLNWFFEQFVKGTQTLDYEVVEYTSARPAAKLGVYDKDGQKAEVKEGDAKPDDKAPFENEVIVRRVGEAWFPVELLVTLENGDKVLFKPIQVGLVETAQSSGKPGAPAHLSELGQRLDGSILYQASNSQTGHQWPESWALRERWKKFKFATTSKIQSVQLDPNNKVQLDANLTNNSKTDTAAIGAAVRWTAGLTFWLQTLLQALAALS